MWARDEERGAQIADQLEVAMVYVDEHGTTMPALPFAGVKRSGFGRELASLGIVEFANQKLVRVASRRETT